MSQGPSDSQIVAAYQADLATAFVISSITTAYEYVITIEREVVMVWWRKWTLATWIFIVNRYLMITVVIMEIAPASAKR
ncbi:hypothetical protein EW026_g820 [Hermanssonia centrifuga]|uniref:DUF6533 domain-containing protein n=1 Tax=Hermanssonia centrifuga TaxID=98765 RepID=A0A4S4KTF7_9APHY|nr:hypothetical protein EW026_g820 [Hermanssonia centrifuga]